MSAANLLIERDAETIVVTINRPSVLNALDAATLNDLRRVVAQVRDDAGIRVMVVTGAGPKAFAAGADVKELEAAPPVGGWDRARLGQTAFDEIERLGKPVIAAVNGIALGGGCELALACTIRIASDRAAFGQPEVNLGLIPGFGGSQRLPRLVGRGRALELLLTGTTIDAEEACRIGLVNRVVPEAELMPVVRALARTIAAKPPLAVRLILAAVTEGLEMPLDSAERHEATLFGLAFSTEDMREGVRAFLEKRAPAFKGR